ncbi:hypothetical protein ACA910_018071 [Epithemia clementina (nom. ined.)]
MDISSLSNNSDYSEDMDDDQTDAALVIAEQALVNQLVIEEISESLVFNNLGKVDRYRGNYEINGICTYCRWVGNWISGGDPSIKTYDEFNAIVFVLKQSWSCLSGNSQYTPSGNFPFPYKKSSCKTPIDIKIEPMAKGLVVEEWGYKDAWRGNYKIDGVCTFCRWVGGGGSRGNPSILTSNGNSWWSCVSGSTAVTPRGTFPFPYKRSDCPVSFYPSRTEQQRADLCSKDAETKSKWDAKDRSAKFAIKYFYGSRSCIQSVDGGSNEFADCTVAKTEWMWRSDGKLQSGVKEAHGLDTCYYTTTSLRACQETYLPTEDLITNEVTAAVCPCGQDMVGSTCKDIDECMEDHECPEHSDCINVVGGYECKCSAGYENFLTGGPAVEKTGRCVSAPKQVTDKVGVTSFEISVSNITPGKVKMTLHQLADDSANLAVAVQLYSNMFEDFVSQDQVKVLKFDDLNPGSRYVLHIIILDTSDDPNNPREGKTHYGPVVTTKCYCSIVDTDDSGKPDSAIVWQHEGFVQFQWTDNSRCEDAYSFSRGLSGGSIGQPDEGTPAGNDDNNEVFTSDYYFFSRQQCAQEPYIPGRQIADDLRVSNLVVGQEYQYQIRAASKHAWRNSNPTTVKHVVLWQASIDGQVTLEESAGLLPVENVVVEYRMEDLDGFILPVCEEMFDGWCRVLTTPSGKFKVNLSLNHPSLNNNDDFPVRMRFGKTTANITHRFLCNDATRDCSTELLIPMDDPDDEGLPENATATDESNFSTTVVYLRHLEFKEPVHVIDDTTVPFRGKVTVKGTEMPGEGALGCAILGAEVCLLDHTTRNAFQLPDPVCVTTDSEGNYALPAVIGTVISPEVRYHDHVFQSVDPKDDRLFAAGILIQPDGVYENFNLHDVTTTLLTVEVAGGLCDRVLGESEILLKMQGCEWDGRSLVQQDFRQVYDVIAQPLDLRVVGVKGLEDGQKRNVIIDALSPSQDTSIDLRDLEDEDAAEDQTLPQGVGTNNTFNAGSEGLGAGSSEEAALEEEQKKETERTNMKRIRFQYDGADVLQVSFGNMDTGTCGSSAEEEGVDSYSYHVLPSITFFVVRVMARQEFGYDDITPCTIYPVNTTISIQNQVGVDDSPGDRDFISELEANPDFQREVRALRACNPSCSHPLQMDQETGENAQAAVVLMTGQPNPFGVMSKPLFVVLDRSGTIHKSEVVVTGDFALAGSQSVALPTHKPLLVIRDPPGGNSYTYYENMVSTIRVEMEQYETFVGIDGSAKGNFGSSSEISACAGFGVSLCLEVAEAKSWGALGDGGDTTHLVSLVDGTNSGTFTTTWSCRTSIDEWTAGKNSDVFLVPSLNAKFKKVQEVKFDKNSSCATATEKIKFSLTSPENKPAISFLSRFDIENVEIPELQSLRDAAEANATEFNCTDTIDDETSDDCVKAIITRNAMNEALEDWTGFLGRHDEVSSQVGTGKLNGLKPHTWFDHSHKDATDDEKAHIPDSHWSGLVPKTLADSAVRIRSIGSALGDGDQDEAEELERVNVLKFDGGGAEFRYELKRSRVTEHTKKLGPPKDNMQKSFYIDGSAHFDLFSVGLVGVDVALGRHENDDNHHTQTDKDEDESKIGFVLGDADSGDVFDIEVYLDPDYGTFVFHLISGISRCPVEEGTTPREQPAVSLKSRPSASLLPDDVMIFEVELTNQGISPSSFQLFTDHRPNGGLLGHLANGDTLTVPQQYDRIEPGETVTTTITIARGPALYDFPAIPVIFRSACENVRNIGDGNLIALDNRASASMMLFNVVDPSMEEGENERIRFAQPCPGIAWEGDLAFERSFGINAADRQPAEPQYTLEVVVRNLDYYKQSYKGSVADPLGRLADAGLWFRRVGAAAWSRAMHRPPGEESSIPIDFTALEEDDYGYLTVEWDVGALGDGEYEIEARTLCPDPTGDLPADFNFAATSRIQGTIDRIAPSMYGSSFTGRYTLEDPVVIEFTETIECARPHSFSLSVTLNENRTWDNTGDGLLVVCEGRYISFQLNPEWVDRDELIGENAQVELSGVQDLNGNEYDGLISGIMKLRRFSQNENDTETDNFTSHDDGGQRGLMTRSDSAGFSASWLLETKLAGSSPANNKDEKEDGIVLENAVEELQQEITMLRSIALFIATVIVVMNAAVLTMMIRSKR